MRKSTVHTTGFLASAAATVALLAGCSMGQPDTVISRQETSPIQSGQVSPEKTPESEEAEAASSTGTSQESEKVTATSAAETALGTRPGSRVLEISLDRVRGVTAWEVELVTAEGRWEVSVDAVTGEIVLDESESTRDLTKYLDRLDRAKLDHTAAIEAALGAVPGGSLVEIELDDHHGNIVWEADVISGEHVKHEVVIDAVTGAVLENEVDD